MAFTVNSILDGTSDIVPTKIGDMAQRVADRALDGARGNSGVILAQFFQGLSDGAAGGEKMTPESFAKAIELGIEPPSDGNWGRQVMEVLFAAETSSITGEDVVLDSGLSWVHQSTGSPITTDHGWY